MPELTIPKQLSKEELYGIVLRNIREVGWNFSYLSNPNSFPLKIRMTNENKVEDVLIYIWNISQGGKTRNPNEYRIQLKGKELTIGDSFKTLLFGWFDEEKVFASFDAFNHRKFGKSPSVQVNRDTLHSAAEHGVAFQYKKTPKGEDIIVAFQPNLIMEYITEIYPQYHKNSERDVSVTEVEVLVKPLDVVIPTEELNRVPERRKMVVRTINEKVREAKFQRYVFTLYMGRCAICGLQARLTEAAHIIPVGGEGSDELVNGILLCRNHHKAYDSGLLAITKDYIIVLNEKHKKWLSDSFQDNKLKEFIDNSRIGEKIALPEDTRFYPKKKYLEENCRLKGV